MQTNLVSKKALWTGRILSGVTVFLLALDGAMKLAKPQPVVDAFVKLGYDPNTSVGIGGILLVSTALYAFRRTSFLGALLLTAFLGGATATNVRVAGPAFSIVFPAIMGALVWGGLVIRDARLHALFGLTTEESNLEAATLAMA